MRQYAKFVALQVLWAYKWAVSPLFPPSCRYIPTCSDYAMEAVERYGALRGTMMIVARLLRCHPFARGGYDPVVRAEHGRNSIPGNGGTSATTCETAHDFSRGDVSISELGRAVGNGN